MMMVKESLKGHSLQGRTVQDQLLTLMSEIFQQAVPVEQAFLGALLLCQNPTELRIALETVRPEHFLYQPHREIYQACRNVFQRQESLDVVSVHTELIRIGTTEDYEPMPYLMRLMELTPTSNPTSFCESLLTHSLKNYLLTALPSCAKDIAQAATITETLQVLQRLTKEVETQIATSTVTIQQDIQTGKDVFVHWLQSLEQANDGFPTGLVTLDEHLAPLSAGTLVLIGARPSVGKTALLLQWMMAVLRQNRPCLFLSYEMPAKQLIQRLIAQTLLIPYSTLSFLSSLPSDQAAQHMKRIAQLADDLAQRPLFFIDKPLPLSAIKLHLHSQPVSAIFVDYLQQIPPPQRREHRYQEVGDIVRELKRWAKEFKCLVVAAVQLSRATEGRAEKKPTLADLRESGDLEAEADIVLLLHALNTTRRLTINGTQLEGKQTDIIIAKNRNGSTATVPTLFLPPFVRFVACDDHDYSNPIHEGVK